MLKKTPLIFLINLFLLLFLPSSLCLATNYNIGFEPSCSSILLYNLDSDSVVYSKNATEKVAPASLTKIMTYIIVAEEIQDIDNTMVEIKKEVINKLLGTGSSMSNIKAGESYSVNQLLHCMMIKSGNDAALALADYITHGNIEDFVNKMNKRAGELGCDATHFSNPHGLYAEDHYTTAEDLLKITKYAMTLPNFLEITSKVTSNILGEDKYPLVTTNSMIDPVRGGKYYYKYAKGIKTGYEALAGRCLVSTAVNNGYTYICIALGGFSEKDNLAMLDSKALYQWAFNNLSLKPIIDKNKPIGEVKLNFAWGKDSLQLLPAGDYSAMLPKAVLPASIDIKLNVPQEVTAPVKVGQKVGTADLFYANSKVATIDVVSSENIRKNYFLFFAHVFKSIISSIWFKIAFVLLLIFIAFYIRNFLRYSKKKKKKIQINKRRYRYK
ncbi:MAG: D-alanyl-D-alanine carboxypeptidase [Clostridia bacterium]|nr:D-alanyl-D-alanine carboxypeptidase [Clostridia bacterium]